MAFELWLEGLWLLGLITSSNHNLFRIRQVVWPPLKNQKSIVIFSTVSITLCYLKLHMNCVNGFWQSLFVCLFMWPLWICIMFWSSGFYKFLLPCVNGFWQSLFVCLLMWPLWICIIFCLSSFYNVCSCLYLDLKL